MPTPEELVFNEASTGLPDTVQLGGQGIENENLVPFGAELLTDTPATPERLSLAACIKSGVADSNADDTTVQPPYDYSIGFDGHNRPTVYELQDVV